MERTVGPQPGGDLEWGRRAHGVYRDLMAGGIKPDLMVLDKLVACLRIPYRPDEDHQRRKEARQAEEDFHVSLALSWRDCTAVLSLALQLMIDTTRNIITALSPRPFSLCLSALVGWFPCVALCAGGYGSLSLCVCVCVCVCVCF